MADINAVLSRLDQWLTGARSTFLAALRGPASDATLAALTKKLGRAMGADLEALLRWHDGAPDDEDLIWNYRLMSASEIGAAATMMRGHVTAGQFDDKIDWWVDGWVPFLDNGGGDWFCVDLVGSFGGAPGQVIEFWHDDAPREIVAPSLAAWLDAIASGAEAGLLDGATPRDDDAFEAHFARALPGFPKAASARKNDAKAKARVSARDAIKSAIDALEGPREGLAARVEDDKILKGAKPEIAEAKQALLARRESAVAEVYEVFPAPGAKRIAYAVWSTSTVGADWRDGYIVGVDLKGNTILKEKKVKA